MKHIVIKNSDYHGIPEGTVVEEVGRSDFRSITVKYKDDVVFLNEHEFIPVVEHPELEAEYEERDYQRFWWWLRNLPWLVAGIVGVIVAIGFLVTYKSPWDIVASFSSLALSLVVLLILADEKEIFEHNLMNRK